MGRWDKSRFARGKDSGLFSDEVPSAKKKPPWPRIRHRSRKSRWLVGRAAALTCPGRAPGFPKPIASLSATVLNDGSGRSRVGKAWLVLEGRVASHPLPHPRRRKVELVRLTSTTGRSSDLQALGASAAPAGRRRPGFYWPSLPRSLGRSSA